MKKTLFIFIFLTYVIDASSQAIINPTDTDSLKVPVNQSGQVKIIYNKDLLKGKLNVSDASLQGITALGRTTTRSIDVNGIVSRDSTLSIAPIVVAAPSWIAADSSNYPFSRIGVNQGIAWDANYKYLDSNAALIKVDSNYNIIWANRSPFSGLDSVNHMGDFFWNRTDGRLYVPMETINSVGNVFSGQKIGIFDTADGHRISVISASSQHASEITAFTKYDSSIASIDFYTGRIIYLRSFTDASVLDSISLSLPIPGAQGITFDSTNRLFYIISETKLWSTREDGSGVLELMTLPHDVLGHVGEGLEMINSSLTGLVASRGSGLSKVYTFQPLSANTSYTQRAAIDGNGIASLRYINIGPTSSISPITIYDGTPSKLALVHPNSIANGYLGHDPNATTLTRNGVYNKGWQRNDPLSPSFYFSLNGAKSAAYMLVSNAGTGKISWDTAWKSESGGKTIFKSALGSSGPNQIVAQVEIAPRTLNNTLSYANVSKTALYIHHDTTSSMMIMQNTSTGGGRVFFHVPDNANASLGKKFLINFADNTSAALFTLDSATQSLRIRNHIGIGTALNANPSGLATASLSVSDVSASGRVHADFIGNRNTADQVSSQIAAYNNSTTRFAAISFLRGTSDTQGYIKFTTNSGTFTDRWQISESGHFLGAADNTYDIGASGATRPRTGYFGTSIRSPKYETAASVQWTSSTGSPEGVVAANVGSMYTRTDGGANTTLYVKESGTGNTGWVAK